MRGECGGLGAVAECKRNESDPRPVRTRRYHPQLIKHRAAARHEILDDRAAGAHQPAQIDLIEIALHVSGAGKESGKHVVDGLCRRAQMLLDIVAQPLQIMRKPLAVAGAQEGLRQFEQE